MISVIKAVYSAASAPKKCSGVGGNGAQGRNRTTDTAIFSRMLYQLSYLGVRALSALRVAVYR